MKERLRVAMEGVNSLEKDENGDVVVDLGDGVKLKRNSATGQYETVEIPEHMKQRAREEAEAQYEKMYTEQMLELRQKATLTDAEREDIRQKAKAAAASNMSVKDHILGIFGLG